MEGQTTIADGTARPGQKARPPSGPGGIGNLAAWLIAAAIAVYAAVPVIANMAHAADPLRFNDDARQQIWPFMRFYDTRLFRNDAIADYYLACTPAGYKLLYSTVARWIDPRGFSKVLPYLLLAITVAAAARAAGRLEGRWAGWATATLCLASTVFLERMGGGLPRAFAFPLYALAALALIDGRPILLAAVVVVGAAFYPTVAVTCGLSLAALLLLLPARHRGGAANWGLLRRLAFTSGTAVLAFLLVLPTQRASSAYGAIIRGSDAAEYPEVGPGGRYRDDDRAPGLFSRSDLAEYVRAPLSGLGASATGKSLLFKVPLWLFAAIGIFGTAMLIVRDVRTRRLLILAAAAVLVHIISIPLSPYLYLPERYLAYPLPVIAAILVPAGIAALPMRFARASHVSSARGPTVLVICGAYLLFLFCTAGRGVRTAGIDYVANAHSETYKYIREQTKTYAIIAGWPSDLDDIPYVCGRTVLVSRETHQAFHRDFTDRMRARTNAVIDALYAPDRPGLMRLQDFGVNYLLVNLKLYRPGPPTYFAPFGQRAADDRKALGMSIPDARREFDRAAVVRDGDWVLLDLDLLPFKRDARTTLNEPQPSGPSGSGK